MDYNELKKRVDKYSNNTKARRKESYHYARDKGFSPKEAMVLASKGKEEIDKLAKERDDGKVADGS
jgi:hypothetical protein